MNAFQLSRRALQIARRESLRDGLLWLAAQDADADVIELAQRTIMRSEKWSVRWESAMRRAVETIQRLGTDGLTAVETEEP